MRIKKANDTMHALANCGNEEEYKKFFFDFLKSNGELTLEFQKHNKVHKLSPEESMNLMRCLRLRGRGVEKLKRFLSIRRLDFFPSLKSISNAKKEKLKNIRLSKGTLLLFKDTVSGETVRCPFSKVDDLLEMVKLGFEEFRGKEEELIEIDKKWVVVFGGDKGGDVMSRASFVKFTYNIMTKDKPQDFKNFEVYALYSGPDTYKNYFIFHWQYKEAIEQLQNIEILGKQILVLIAGDNAHQSCIIGQSTIFTTLK